MKQQFLKWLRLTNKPIIKVYNSYGNNTHIIVQGHVLKRGPLQRKRYRKFFLTNVFAAIRSFWVKPWPGIEVELQWEDKIYKTRTEDDGFYKFEFTSTVVPRAGWHPVRVCLSGINIQAEGWGEIYIPYTYQYAFISDIDDTFLISHSANLRKRLYVLLTKNAKYRKPFEGVVNHYQLLAADRASLNTYNPFFYVSSSEWNLYDFIVEFCRLNKMPKGVFLLNQMKTFRQILKTGQNKHATKFFRIVRILEHYPDQKYVLLGDDSQEDPNIYEAVVKHFPEKIYAVYLRQTRHSNKQSVLAISNNMQKSGVECCYFKHSAEAIIHSKKIGLITADSK